VRLEPDRPAAVACWLLADDGLGARLDQIDTRLATLGLRPEITTRRADDAEWAEAWKEHFHVTRVGRRTVIRPSWRDYDPRPDEIVIDLDPGMAFGTGQHETTRGCLTLLEDAVQAGARVLDLGTGSGILAIAAAKLGAGEVLALDVEPQSVAVARENAERNGVTDRVQVVLGSLGEDRPFAQSTDSFALVVANIHARALIALAPAIASVTLPQSCLVLSGIVAEREADVAAAYEELRFTVTRSLAEGDWRTLALRRATDQE
jgi:ribosomal protein L11 methyltransferase